MLFRSITVYGIGEQISYLYNIGFSGDYFDWGESGEQLYVIRSGDLYGVDTLQQRLILSGESLSYPAISPDRNYLACVSGADGNALIIIDLSFGDYVIIKQIRLPLFACDDYRLVDWSPDSREISFIDYKDGQWNIFMTNRSGYDPIVQITNDDIVKNALCQ